MNIQLKNVSVRNGANVLSLAVIDGKVIIIGEQQIVSFSKDMNITLEEVSKKMIELENEDKEQYTFKEHDTKKVVLPKTSVKIRSESWTRDIAKTTLKSYLRIFNLGKNSKLRFGDACNEPAGWPPSLSFADFKGVSYATKENLTKIVESLIRHHMDVDPVTYYDSAVRRDRAEMTWNLQMKTVIKIWSKIMVILRLLTISSNKLDKTCIKEIILRVLPSHLTQVVNGIGISKNSSGSL